MLLIQTACWAGAVLAPAEAPCDVALHGVAVFDSRRAQVLPGKTVLIEGGKVLAIQDASEPFEAEQTIEGKGRLLTPGFVDTHIHLMQDFAIARDVSPERLEESRRAEYFATLAERYIGNGTTTLVDMGQSEAWLETSIGWIRDPSLGIPDLFVVGGALCSILDWDRQPPPHHVQLADAQAARAKVAAYQEFGIEHLKLYWKLEAPEMQAIVQEADERGMRLYAHIDNNIASMRDAMELGVRHFEHFFTLIPGILDLGSIRPLVLRKYGLRETRTLDEFAASMVLFFDYIRHDEFLNVEMMALLEELGASGGSISTALNVLATAAGRSRVFSSFDHFPLRSEAELPSFDQQAKERLSRAFDSMLHYLLQAHELGVTLRIGTDTRKGGEALLAELALLVEAGIPAEEVLRIATWNGARCLGIEDRSGAIEPGRRADLVLFSQNPLEDPAHFFADKTVFHGGKVFGE